MRILFWSSAFWPSIGGVQVLAAKLLPALEERGYQHMVVSTKRGCVEHEIASYKGIPVHYFPFWNSMVDIEQLAQMRQQVAELKRTFAPDLIHINGVSRSDFFHHLTADASPAPVLVSLHSVWQPEADRLVERTLRHANWVVGCSAATLEEGRQRVPEMQLRSSVLHNGLEVPPVQPAPLSCDPPRLLCLGRLVREKGFDVALDAFTLLLDRFPQAHLIIAGDGPARDDLEQQASRLGLRNAVEFTGWVAPAQIPELVNTASVVVIPSRCQDAFGLVALEAALMARPVVAMRVGGLPEVVVHGQTGLLVEPENIKACAEAITVLLEQPATAAQMGQKGRDRARKYFSLDGYIEAYEALYRRLITE